MRSTMMYIYNYVNKNSVKIHICEEESMSL